MENHNRFRNESDIDSIFKLKLNYEIKIFLLYARVYLFEIVKFIYRCLSVMDYFVGFLNKINFIRKPSA